MRMHSMTVPLSSSCCEANAAWFLFDFSGRRTCFAGAPTVDGSYVGGADRLSAIVDREVEPNPDRGQCSLSRVGMAS